uniref:Uncharacterized protein n=1 Tax=Populus alba TaxID=43335 RepID=A0A4U5Q009_POPAL|nr:hypothetical protein D5086_0000161230 [Populus alba]
MSGRPFECPLPYFSEKPFTTIKDRGLFTFGNLATPVTTCCRYWWSLRNVVVVKAALKSFFFEDLLKYQRRTPGRDVWQNAWPPALEARRASESARAFSKNPAPMGIRPGGPSLSAGASWALPRSPIRCLDVSYTPRGAKRAYGLAI